MRIEGEKSLGKVGHGAKSNVLASFTISVSEYCEMAFFESFLSQWAAIQTLPRLLRWQRTSAS